MKNIRTGLAPWKSLFTPFKNGDGDHVLEVIGEFPRWFFNFWFAMLIVLNYLLNAICLYLLVIINFLVFICCYLDTTKREKAK